MVKIRLTNWKMRSDDERIARSRVGGPPDIRGSRAIRNNHEQIKIAKQAEAVITFARNTKTCIASTQGNVAAIQDSRRRRNPRPQTFAASAGGFGDENVRFLVHGDEIPHSLAGGFDFPHYRNRDHSESIQPQRVDSDLDDAGKVCLIPRGNLPVATSAIPDCEADHW